jgi:hypothetical protein
MDIHHASEHGINPSYRPGDRSNLGSSAASAAASAAEFLAQQHRDAAFRSKESPTAPASGGGGEPAPGGRPMTEEEQMARALQESLGADASLNAGSRMADVLPSDRPAPIMQRSTSLEDSQDMALQAALLESRASSSASPGFAAAPSAAAQSGVAAAARSAAERPSILSPGIGFDGVVTADDWDAAREDAVGDEDDGDDHHGGGDGDDAVDTWSDDDSSSAAASAGGGAGKSPAKAAPAASSNKAPKRFPEFDCPYCGAQHQTNAQFETHLAECAYVDQ